MFYKRSDVPWVLQQSVELFSWTGISWFVALFLGLWGVMVGMGVFLPAYLFIGICISLCAAKWGHVTCIHKASRRIVAFSFGIVILIIIAISLAVWTHGRKVQASEDVKKLEPLKEIPEMQETITRLQRAYDTESAAAKKQQGTIEDLTRTVITQQEVIAKGERVDLDRTTATISGLVQKSQDTLSSNINQYRTDTSSAVGKILRPGRTLGENRKKLILSLKQLGPYSIAITPARGSSEVLAYAEEIKSAFIEAGWSVVPTKKMIFVTSDAVGLSIITKVFPSPSPVIVWGELTASQSAVGRAFSSIAIPLSSIQQDKGDTDPTELYVGLQ